MSIVELSALVLFNDFVRIASRHFIDYSGKLSTQDAADLMRARARRVQFESYSAYGEWRHAFEAAARAARRAHGGDLDVATREKFRNHAARVLVPPTADGRRAAAEAAAGLSPAEQAARERGAGGGDRGAAREGRRRRARCEGGGGARRRSKPRARHAAQGGFG